ncbi:MAG TPA: hypothetical protein PKA95_15465, partial [Thermomicrobiales bacterium]|nr:hypothetical protein [Thermomicrobiales bacterium]
MLTSITPGSMSRSAASAASAAALPARDLVEQRADPVDRSVRLAQPVAQLAQHVALGGQVGVARLDPRVAQHLERLGLLDAIDLQPRLVLPRQHLRPVRPIPRLQAARHRLGAGLAHVPDEVVEARQRGRPRCLLGVAAVAADLIALGVEDRQRHRPIRRRRQEVLDDDTVRRVAAGRQVVVSDRAVRSIDRVVEHLAGAGRAVVDHPLDRRPAEATVAPQPDGRLRGEQPRRARVRLPRQLPQDRHVVEHPERAPVGRDHQLVALD